MISPSKPSNVARILQPVKFLSQREQYVTCHVKVPGDPHRLSAIALNGRFYSFFRLCQQVSKALGLILKLTGRGDAVVVTSTSRGYALWVEEPDAVVALPAHGKIPRTIPPTFGPADCWVISDRQPEYRTCTLKVPDLPDVVPGLTNDKTFYSLYRREKDGNTVLKLAARLSDRGDEVVILVALEGYVICIHEPGATLA